MSTDNPWDLMRAAVDRARNTIRAANHMVNQLAPLMVDRLRHVDSADLVRLKRELRDFDAHTKRWKS